MLFALGLGDLDQIFRAEPGRFGEYWAGDADLVMARETADHRRRRLRDGRQLFAHFGKRNSCADIGDRADFNGLDQALEHIVEQLDLLAVEAAGGKQKEFGDALDGLQALFGGSDFDRGFDFVGDRSLCMQHCSS